MATFPDPEFILLKKESVARLNDTMIRYLTARQERILRMYYGFGRLDSHTGDAIGTEFGVTRERVHQLRNRAIGRLIKVMTNGKYDA